MYVYLLERLSASRKLYVGITRDLGRRLKEHNAGSCPHTAKFKPWRFRVAVWFRDDAAAWRFERYLKTGSGRAFSKNHL